MPWMILEKPDDLPKFAAAHFQALLRQREGTLKYINKNLKSFAASGTDPFTSSAAINEETLPPKFEKPLPESQRIQSPAEVSPIPRLVLIQNSFFLFFLEFSF